MKLYQILIPNLDNKGLTFPSDIRRDFLLKVSGIVGGATMLNATQQVYGVWRGHDGSLFTDSSAPMLVAVETKHQLQQIMSLARTTFEQDSIMAWLVSEEVIFNEDSGN